MKYFVISDVHDHYSLMKTALDANGFDPAREDHKLILCGDAFFRGPESGETYEYLKNLYDAGKLVFIYGNHDYELADCLTGDGFGKPNDKNRVCAAGIVQHMTGKTGLSDRELCAECWHLGLTRFLLKAPVPYYETAHYVFTHGFIPTNGDKKKTAYRADWRSASAKEWCKVASIGDGMVSCMRDGIRVPDKTIVFGHYSAARCIIMENASPADWENGIYLSSKPAIRSVPLDAFKPYFGDGFIAMDQGLVEQKKRTKKEEKWFVNCIVLEDDPV